jgi:hypothetical protein
VHFDLTTTFDAFRALQYYSGSNNISCHTELTACIISRDCHADTTLVNVFLIIDGGPWLWRLFTGVVHKKPHKRILKVWRLV